MPQRTNPFIDNAYYHVFNRGVEKRTIYQNNQDYFTFLDILTYYLKFTTKSPLNALTRTGLVNTGIFQDEIKLLSYNLMPNHFHLLIHQSEKDSTTRFMRRVGTTYAMYFNRRYRRVGSLFQGRFKAKYIDTDEYLLQTSKYIHRNLPKPVTRTGLVNYPWSSLTTYTSTNQQISLQPIGTLIDTSIILDYFHQENSHKDYLSFVIESPPSKQSTTPPHWIK